MPPNILLTTPESLHLLLTDENSADFFHTLNCVVVDAVVVGPVSTPQFPANREKNRDLCEILPFASAFPIK